MSVDIRKKVRDLLWLLQKGGDSISDITLDKIKGALEKAKRYDYPEEDEESDTPVETDIPSEVASMFDDPEKIDKEQTDPGDKSRTPVPGDKPTASALPIGRAPDPGAYSMDDPETLKQVRDIARQELSQEGHMVGEKADEAVNPIKAKDAYQKNVDLLHHSNDLAGHIASVKDSEEYKNASARDKIKMVRGATKEWNANNAKLIEESHDRQKGRIEHADMADAASKKMNIDQAKHIIGGGGVSSDDARTVSTAEAADAVGAPSDEEGGSTVSQRTTEAQKKATEASIGYLQRHIDAKKSRGEDTSKEQELLDRRNEIMAGKTALDQQAKAKRGVIEKKKTPLRDWFLAGHEHIKQGATRALKDKIESAIQAGHISSYDDPKIMDAQDAGLLSAAHSYDPSGKASWPTHASNHIKGKIQDAIGGESQEIKPDLRAKLGKVNRGEK